MSLLLAKHVAAGGLARHAALVRAGNVNLPTAPFGAAAPAQLPEFDQPGLPTGAPPLHVKSVCARADGGSASAKSAPMRATRNIRRLLRALCQLRREAEGLAARLPGELRAAGRALRLDRGGESLGHLLLPGLGVDRGLPAERDLALAHLCSPYAGAVRVLHGAVPGLRSEAEIGHVHVRDALVAVNHYRDVVVRRPCIRVLVVPGRMRAEAVSHHDSRNREGRRSSGDGGELASMHHNLPKSMPPRSSQSRRRGATAPHESSVRFRPAERSARWNRTGV